VTLITSVEPTGTQTEGKLTFKEGDNHKGEGNVVRVLGPHVPKRVRLAFAANHGLNDGCMQKQMGKIMRTT
jgi:hypothetical protein